MPDCSAACEGLSREPEQDRDQRTEQEQEHGMSPDDTAYISGLLRYALEWTIMQDTGENTDELRRMPYLLLSNDDNDHAARY